jgi:sterol 3beta-glucosyltransferase
MKVLFLTLGTRGDCQPYVALGMGLVAKGHQVRIVATRDHAQLIEEESGGTIEHVRFPWAFSDDINSPDMVAALKSGSTIAVVNATQRQFEDHFSDCVRCCEEAIKEWPDVVLANMLLLDIGWGLCEKYNKRLIYAFLQPWTASRYHQCFLIKVLASFSILLKDG